MQPFKMTFAKRCSIQRRGWYIEISQWNMAKFHTIRGASGNGVWPLELDIKVYFNYILYLSLETVINVVTVMLK